MDGFGLLCGHLLGDYILQNDWMAKNKVDRSWWPGFVACFIHCVLYTAAIWVCSFWWMPWWGLLVVFGAHFPVDRWRLARRWMSYSGQESFATGPLSPWSVIAVDNTVHLLTLFVIGLLA